MRKAGEGRQAGPPVTTLSKVSHLIEFCVTVSEGHSRRLFPCPHIVSRSRGTCHCPSGSGLVIGLAHSSWPLVERRVLASFVCAAKPSVVHNIRPFLSVPHSSSSDLPSFFFQDTVAFIVLRRGSSAGRHLQGGQMVVTSQPSSLSVTRLLAAVRIRGLLQAAWYMRHMRECISEAASNNRTLLKAMLKNRI